MQKLRGALIALGLVLALTPAQVFAQGFQIGNIAGVVTDSTGAALPGVTVTVTNTQRGGSRTDVTDNQGRYRFSALPLGVYSLEASLQGFRPAKRDKMQVEAEKTSSADLTLGLAAATEAITVTATTPVVDPTNVAQTTSVSTREFEKAPVGRTYQDLAHLAPGVVGGANPNSSGSLSSSNQFLFDGVDTTDPATGTFGSNLNFEAIQEVNVLTSAVSAEYGRATGAIVNVITKSGTNAFAGSVKAIAINDNWNADNKVTNTQTGASLQRTVVDHNNVRYAATLGGPAWRDHIWFFGAYDQYKPLGSNTRTPVSGEEWSSNPYMQFENYRVTAQLTPSHNIFARYARDPYTGIVRGDYGGGGGDLFAIHTQEQGGAQKAVQYAGVFGSKISAEGMVSTTTSKILVGNYRSPGPFDNGSAVYDENTGRYLNGSFFATGNGTDRPRKQFAFATSYFTSSGKMTHDIKVGIDRQEVKSSAYYSYTNNRMYDIYFNPNYTMDKTQDGTRYDFINTGAQTSEGKIDSVYLRDKLNLGRFYLDAGVRYEMQTGNNDVGTKVVDATSLAPRLSGSYDLKGDGRSLVTASAGRFYDFILQTFIDGYAQTVQRGVYDVYSWNIPTQAWDFNSHIDLGGGTINPNLSLKAPYVDEMTVGFQQRLGASTGIGARLIIRKWNNLIDDYRRYENGVLKVSYQNEPLAKRKYNALQLTLDKRFSERWSLLANYVYSKAEGNDFGTSTSAVNNFVGMNCKIASDSVTLPCNDVLSHLYGRAAYDYPHNLKVLGVYSLPVGPVNLTFGGAGEFRSGGTYTKTATASVLSASGGATGQTLPYYYNGLGSDRLDSWWQIDGSAEATYSLPRGIQVGLKGEVFNITDTQKAIGVTSQVWCEANTASCAATQKRYGSQTTTGNYQPIRNFRLSALIRF